MGTSISGMWNRIQSNLLPFLTVRLPQLNEAQLKFAGILEMVRIEDHVHRSNRTVGRPENDRKAIARAFTAKLFFKLPTTRALHERLEADEMLRRLCGWEEKIQLPSEATLSRAFDEFSQSGLPQKVHEALVKEYVGPELVMHLSRDSTEIKGREKPVKKTKTAKPPRKRGRPATGEIRPVKEPTRLEKQAGQTLEEMMNGLPTCCDVGTKRNSKGYQESWCGYKLHIDAADGQIPVSCILTSASLHDSQAALPLAAMSAGRIRNLYDLMDSAYWNKTIIENSRNLEHVPIIEANPGRNAALKEKLRADKVSGKILNFEDAEKKRYKERTNVERVNSRLKDDFGGNTVRVRGHAKVLTHLMFGILILTAEQLLKIACT